jgi:hypothetical protein
VAILEREKRSPARMIRKSGKTASRAVKKALIRKWSVIVQLALLFYLLSGQSYEK